jgi:ASC-1-like (ASCH) protein
MKKIIIFNLKTEYFNDIKNDKKPLEYRLYNNYWKKRLVGKVYDEVHFKLGYPKNDETKKIIKRKYLGYSIININHKHFNNYDSTKVFAISTKGDLTSKTQDITKSKHKE